MGSFGGDELSEWESESPGPPGSAPRGRGERIQVYVRMRPLNDKEVATNDFADWECIDSNTIVFKNTVGERTIYPNAYVYDKVYGPSSSTREIYDEAAKEVALSVVNGINSSIFAYGQTSSGKTYTMAGITQYTIEDIFDYIEKHDKREFVLKFSALEIYNEVVRDLLSEDTTPLRLLDDPEKGTVVERLTEETLRDKSHLLELIAVCEAQRQIGETALNETSSRSHQILRLTVESSISELAEVENSSTLSATVNCVDLAGSERSSQSAGTRLKEGCHINRSLLTLGTVIRKLSKGRNGHVPYRDSKLTCILQNSLGGNARTAIICTMSPAHSHVEQSRNTLLFATCAKEVGTNARVNVVMSDKELVKQLRKELARLEGELRNMSPATCKAENPAKLREKELQIEKMDKEIKKLNCQRDLAQARIEELLLSTRQQEASRKQRKTSWLNDSSVGSDYQQLDMALKTSDSSNYLGDQNEIDLNKIYLLDDSEGQFLTDDTSPQFPDEPPELFALGQGYEKLIQATHGDAEDDCKEVRCIEAEEANIIKKNETRVMTNSLDDDNTKEKLETGEISVVPENEFDIVSLMKAEMEPIHSTAEYNEMANRIRELQKTIDNLVNGYSEDNSPFPTKSEMPSARGLILSRSRSCREAFASPPGYQYSGQKLDMMFDRFERQPFGRLQSLPGPCTLNSTVNSSRMNLTSVGNALLTETGQEIKTDNDGYPRLEGKIAGYQQEESREALEDDTSNDQKSDEQGTSASPSCCLQDFEQKQRQIIRLWDSCHSSIVHRSYFFMLFSEANPSDSIYMEVELRRLCFIQSKFSQGAKITMDGQILTHSSSMRALNHEREMLSRQMQKKLTKKEREDLFRKWGIGLHTKRRRLQLARRLWTDPNDMEHVGESAALVAKLNGFTNGGEMPKEMFVGPNFASKSLSKRSYSWRNSFSLVLGEL